MSSTSDRRGRPMRLDADAEDIGKGLGQLVITLLEIVRELLERQALRRIDAGELDEDDVERLGQALLGLQEKFTELREIFGVREGDIRLPADLEDLLTEDRGGTAHRRKDT